MATRYVSDKARRLVVRDIKRADPSFKVEIMQALAAPLFYAPASKELANGLNNAPMRLPANPCWIEFSANFCVIFWKTQTRFEWVLFLSHNGTAVHFALGELHEEGDRIIVDVQPMSKASQKDIEDVEKCVGASAYVAKMIASRESPVIERPLSVSRKMNARKGAGRVFKHYEVDLSKIVRTPTAEHHGGTHASPAWHIRRGHMRTLRDGRQVFVRSCEVGSKERGVVLKDYTLGPDEARL